MAYKTAGNNNGKGNGTGSYQAHDYHSTVIGRYFADLRRFPLLTKEEEQEAARRRRYGELVEPNLSFVVKVASEYRNLGLPFEDLISEGNIGLMEAAYKFDPTKGVKFITYAIWWIRKQIVKALADKSYNVRTPTYIQKKRREVRDAENTLQESLGRKPTEEEVAERLSINPGKLREYKSFERKEISLDERVGKDNNILLSDFLKDNSPNPEVRATREEQDGLVRSLMQELTEQERTVLERRYGFNGYDPKTLKEVGETMGVSRERVRQIESGALHHTRLRIKKIETERQLNRTRKTNSNNGSGNNSHNHGQNVLASYPK